MPVKYKFNPRLNIIPVDVKVQGKENFVIIRMVLDTGSSFTIIPWNVAEAIGYDPAVSKERVDIMTGSGMEKAPKVIVESIEAFGKVVKNCEVLCHNLPQGSFVDGLLGLSFLRNFNISIKFKQGIIEID